MTSSQNVSILDVAHYFLYRSVPVSSFYVTSTKLQKLCYFAQGWHLVFQKGKPLFQEELYAWDIGPASPVIYEVYKKHRYDVLQPLQEIPSVFQTNLAAKQIVEETWEIYGHCDGKFLEELSHQEFPWLLTWNDLARPTDVDSIISHELMQKYFEENINVFQKAKRKKEVKQ